MLVGLLLAAVLLFLGVGTALRQRANLQRLHARSHVPSDEHAYLRGQARRRLVISAILILLGLLIGGSFLSGIEEHATALGDRNKAGEPPSDDEKRFLQFYGALWILIIVLVFGLVCFSILDAWAARRYWQGVFRRLRNDHNTLMQRDLALYRQQRMEAREARIRRGLDEDPSV